MPASPDISIAIPCHNEEGNLKELVRQIDAAVLGQIMGRAEGIGFRPR
jgi:hypothetical protein